MLDMGGIVMGQVQFEVEAPAGTVLDFSYAEDPVTGPTGLFSAACRHALRGARRERSLQAL